jgi:lipid-A-disaccharide synthase-like uncharacterized protein
MKSGPSQKQKRMLVVAFLMLVGPAALWAAFVGLGGGGGEEGPPFKFSDRIATIAVAPGEDGALRATFAGWAEGRPGLTGEEMLAEIHQRRRALPWIYRLLDVTSMAGVLWVIFGFAGQGVFTARMIVQWRASEKARNSIVPPAFWWLSILGASMLMVYFVWRKEIVGFIGQSTGWFVYVRNLWFIYGREESGS